MLHYVILRPRYDKCLKFLLILILTNEEECLSLKVTPRVLQVNGKLDVIVVELTVIAFGTTCLRTRPFWVNQVRKGGGFF
jgi:hypothetical protein